jgi:hypothetical protein
LKDLKMLEEMRVKFFFATYCGKAAAPGSGAAPLPRAPLAAR